MNSDVGAIVKELLAKSGIETRSIKENELAGQVIYAIDAPSEQFSDVAFYDFVHALDHIVKKIAERQSDESVPHFLVDVNDFRTRQIRDLQAKAHMMADRARSFQYDVELTPMTAYERLIVHASLASEPNIKTESQGEGKNRRVVIKYQAA